MNEGREKKSAQNWTHKLVSCVTISLNWQWTNELIRIKITNKLLDRYTYDLHTIKIKINMSRLISGVLRCDFGNQLHILTQTLFVDIVIFFLSSFLCLKWNWFALLKKLKYAPQQRWNICVLRTRTTTGMESSRSKCCQRLCLCMYACLPVWHTS